MPEPTEASIVAALREHYGVSVRALIPLSMGNDMASFVYRIDARDGTGYFLKLRTGSAFKVASLVVPRFLHEQGIPCLVPPLPTINRTFWIHLGDHVLSLYSFIEARTATEAGLSEGQWHALGKTLWQIHSSQLPPHLQHLVPQEAFVPSRRHVLRELEPLISKHDLMDPTQHELAMFWRSRQDDIAVLISRADTLGGELRQLPLVRVLCHADLHTWNVLLDSKQGMWVVDWDETVMAPKERDLMFVIGGIGRDLVSERETASFLQGYGDSPIDHQALVYYRYAWAVQDMAAYAEEVFSSDRSEEARRAALRGFIDLFDSGNIVEIAFASKSGAS